MKVFITLGSALNQNTPHPPSCGDDVMYPAFDANGNFVSFRLIFGGYVWVNSETTPTCFGHRPGDPSTEVGIIELQTDDTLEDIKQRIRNKMVDIFGANKSDVIFLF